MKIVKFSMIALMTVFMHLSLASVVHAEGEVVFVEVERIFRDSIAIRKIRQGINANFQEREGEMNDLVALIREKRDQLQREALTMTEDEVRTLRSEVDHLEIRLRREDKALREDRNLLFNEERASLETEILTVIGQIAGENKYSLVLDSVALLHGGAAVDITDEVIRRLDIAMNAEEPADQ